MDGGSLEMSAITPRRVESVKMQRVVCLPHYVKSESQRRFAKQDCALRLPQYNKPQDLQRCDKIVDELRFAQQMLLRQVPMYTLSM